MCCFYVVATPIGHLDDITVRGIATLKKVDVILAEDTRHTKVLLNHYQITTPLLSLNEHNEQKRLKHIIAECQKGVSFALVSDAGTPLISDPGYLLISTLKRQGITITPIPGANAAITALCASGLSCKNFTFIGFLPVKKHQRLTRLHELKSQKETLIFYESPKRIMTLLTDIDAIFGNERQVCLAKELTKTFETILTQTATQLINWLAADERRQKGEFVVLIAGMTNNTANSKEVTQLIAALLNELPIAKAAKVAAKISGLDKQVCYQLALTLKQ